MTETERPAPRRLLAYRGKKDCRSGVCSRSGPSVRCYGWHCGTCDAPCSEQGHDCPACPECHGTGVVYDPGVYVPGQQFVEPPTGPDMCGPCQGTGRREATS